MNYKVKLVGSSDPTIISAESFRSATEQFADSTPLPESGWIIASDESGDIVQFRLENSKIIFGNDTYAVQTGSVDTIAHNTETTLSGIQPSKNANTQRAVIVDIEMPFVSMVVFMVKWALASIPAFIILSILFAILFAILGILGSNIY